MENIWQNLNSIFGLYKIQKDRIEAQIREYEQTSPSSDETLKAAINKILDEAQKFANQGEFNKSWQILNQADWVKVDNLSPEQLEARKVSLISESGKFDEKRKQNVIELLQITPTTKENLKEAILTRNKYFDTHYHKIAIRSKNIVILIGLLILAIIFTFINSWFGTCTADFKCLVSSAIYGLLGAVLSMAITLTSKPLDEKIPDLVIGISITWLRPIIGIAAGMVALMLLNTDILKTIFNETLVKKENLPVIAFLAGYSERFIISIVDILEKKS